MKWQHNTILITGGSSGIGKELAHILVAQQNHVLICGRSIDKLEEVKKEIPGVQTFSCDLSVQTECVRLFQWVADHYPECNILINNAALVHKTDFYSDEAMVAKSTLEIQTNFLAPVTLSKLFLPLIGKNKNPLIVNITTGLIYAPRIVYPIYNATKAALHAFTVVLREQLKRRNIRVAEVIMTVVDTPWHKGEAPKIAVKAHVAVKEMLTQLESGRNEVMVGRVKLLYILSRFFPQFTFRKINNL